MRQVVIPITTDGSGDCTAYGPETINGLLWSVSVDIGTGGTALANTADITISTINTQLALTLLTLTNVAAAATLYPRGSNCGATGTVTTGANDVLLPLLGKPKVVVAQGGATKVGAVTLFYLES